MRDVAPPTMKEIKQRLEIERHRALLDTARRIIHTSGLKGFTMTQLAADAGCSIGSLYRYFPSRDAVTAELQRDAIDLLATSLQLSQSHLDSTFRRHRVDDRRLMAVVRLVAAARFWTSASDVYPDEIDLSWSVFADPSPVIGDEDAGHVVPAGLRLLEVAVSLLDDAVEVEALDEGDSFARAVMLVAGTAGVLMTSSLHRWVPSLFDGRRLAEHLARDLLISWGADPRRVEEGGPLVDDLAERGRLVPQVGGRAERPDP